MERIHAAIDQLGAKLRAESGGQQTLAGRHGSPCHRLRPAMRGMTVPQASGEFPDAPLHEIDRQDAGDDGRCDVFFIFVFFFFPGTRRRRRGSGRRAPGLEKEELGDGGVAPASILRFQMIPHSPAWSPPSGVRVRVGADAQGELAGFRQRLDQLDRTREAFARAGGEAALAPRRVAAQGDDLGHAGLGIAFGDLERFFPSGVDAGQVGRDRHAVILVDRLDRVMGERARGAAGAIGDGDELRIEGRRGRPACPRAGTTPRAISAGRTRRKRSAASWRF